MSGGRGGYKNFGASLNRILNVHCSVKEMATFTVSLSAYDRANKRNLYVKADGKRFSDNQTIKVCSDVKYDLTVIVKPTNPELKLE